METKDLIHREHELAYEKLHNMIDNVESALKSEQYTAAQIFLEEVKKLVADREYFEQSRIDLLIKLLGL